VSSNDLSYPVSYDVYFVLLSLLCFKALITGCVFLSASGPKLPFWCTRGSTAVRRRTLARSLMLSTFQVPEGFALPAATASFSLRFTAPLLAAEHCRLLTLRRRTACHWRLRRHRLWRPFALDSRRSSSRNYYILPFRLI